MKFFVAVTDNQWFRFLRSKPELLEVNFWRPGGGSFRALDPGGLFLFKLHAPENFIVGGGYYAHFSRLSYRTAWEWFGYMNGVASLEEMRLRISKYRRKEVSRFEDAKVGCVMLTQPFFFERTDWIPIPKDFSLNIVVGKGYDTREEVGKELWAAVMLRLQGWSIAEPGTRSSLFGEAQEIRPRLGQGTFRSLVTDLYARRCAVTGEKALPVLDAAHIKPVSEGGRHEVGNGLLLRSDIHRLYDRGYVTVTPGNRFRVSGRLKTEFDNGEPYYPLEGKEVLLPEDPTNRPRRDLLEWHGDTVFRP